MCLSVIASAPGGRPEAGIPAALAGAAGPGAAAGRAGYGVFRL
jgi:hypothetical protein